MNYYANKAIEDFNDNEKELFHLDHTIFTFEVAPEVLGMAGLVIQMTGGVESLIIDRTILAGTKILGMDEPKTQEEFTAMESAVEASDYSFNKFGKDHEKAWEEFEKEHAEKEAAETSATPEIPETDTLSEDTSEKG